MKKTWKRLIFAALTSSSVFAATFMWYKYSDQSQNRSSNEKPLAYVGRVVEDIQRRPAARLLWQGVNTGEPLFNGEAVRTSQKGEVRIQFADSERYLDLESESLIVIKKTEGEISLDLMEGSLFVNAKGSEAEAGGLVLNSANGKVDLSKASASLSKSSGDSVDVRVLEGRASMRGADGKESEITTGSSGLLGATGFQFDRSNLKILKPETVKPLPLVVENPKPFQFQWQGFPSDSQVSLWVGDTRKNLKEVSTATKNKNELLAPLGLGRHFWKLVAKNPQGQVIAESSTYKAEVVARYGPTILSPEPNATVPADQLPFDMSFRWQVGEDTASLSLEVWADEALSQKIYSQSLKETDSVTLPALKAGTYFWRLSSFFVGDETPLTGQIQKFSLKSAAQVRAENKLPPVPVNVAFTMPADQSTQYYVESPKVDFSWAADKMENVAKWRVQVLSEGQDPKETKPVDLIENKISTPVQKPGRYIASIQAFDKDGQLVGSQSSQAIVVAPLPFLKSPQFMPLDGALLASMDGRTKLTWENISGAKEYWLTIKKNGKELRRSKYGTTSTALKNLLPGEYEVEISAVDHYGRNSEKSESRKLIVPDKSDVKAPTLKKIKVN